MRIVAGTHGGRRLKAPAGYRVRPTPDRVREALFSILSDRVEGARVLDLYAGTGALGLEALSRGAEFAKFVEQSHSVVRVLEDNIVSLGFEDRASVRSGRLPGVLADIADTEPPFDLIFADPPYEQGQTERLLEAPALMALAATDALLIVEVRKTEKPPPGLWHVRERRQYGDTSLIFLTLQKEDT
jgi:16S rRNA (guanine966-N2)-methyltransferase